MKIESITIDHPNLNNRKITLLLVNDNIDIPSTEFLIYESRYGGRYNSLLGKSSHKVLAFQIIELYRHLNDMGLKWDEASEYNIKNIRNAMLCWNKNESDDYSNFDYTPIRNDTMNHKLNTWFKFYKYMDIIKIKNMMVLTTKRNKKYIKKGMLDHLNKRFNYNDLEYIDVWALKVKPSPNKLTYHALSRTEFSKLRQHLRNIDVVYEMLAVLMVETGLRIDAAMKVKATDLKGVFRLLSNGKSINDVVKRSYIPKGFDETYKYDLPIRTMQEINDIYLMRDLNEREYLYENRCERLGIPVNEEILWITKKGKEVKKHDVWSAFSNTSELMGRKQNCITPHWLRHTFATWIIMDVAYAKGIPLENLGTTPHPLLIIALQQKLGHADATTTMKYIVTALKLMGLDLNNGDIKISLRAFLRNKKSQELVFREAMIEFGDDFNEKHFNVVKYALSRGIVIDDESIE
jgi:integrase